MLWKKVILNIKICKLFTFTKRLIAFKEKGFTKVIHIIKKAKWEKVIFVVGKSHICGGKKSYLSPHPPLLSAVFDMP